MKNLKQTLLLVVAQIFMLAPMYLFLSLSSIHDLHPRHFQSTDDQMQGCLNNMEESLKHRSQILKEHRPTEADEFLYVERKAMTDFCYQTSQTTFSEKFKGFFSMFVGSNPLEYLLNASGLFLIVFLIYAAVKYPVKESTLGAFYALGIAQMIVTTLTFNPMSPAWCILAIATCLAAARRNAQIGNKKTTALLMAGVFSSTLCSAIFLVAKLMLDDKALLNLSAYDLNKISHFCKLRSMCAFYSILLLYFFYTVQCLIALRQNILAKKMAFFTASIMNSAYLMVCSSFFYHGGDSQVSLSFLLPFMYPMVILTLAWLFLSLHYVRKKFKQVDALALSDGR